MKIIRDDWRTFGTENGLLEIMQFTGLHDKNGKEIYEGDILRTDAEKEYISAVAYEQAGFKVDSYSDKDVCEHLENIAPHHSAEVIGNIYENPELLDS
jgi:uncharacterized phage protein (TIGR01671 family)